MTKAKQSADTQAEAEAFGQRLLQSIREMKAGNAARVTTVVLNDVVAARQQLGLSQAQFAAALSISKRTLQEWEQERRTPSGAAQALMRIARQHPELVRAALVNDQHAHKAANDA